MKHNYYNYHEYLKNDIQVIDLTENEILEAVKETLKRLKNEWKESDKEKYLQKEFIKKYLNWKKENMNKSNLYLNKNFNIHPGFKISLRFLENNSRWIL